MNFKFKSEYNALWKSGRDFSSALLSKLWSGHKARLRMKTVDEYISKPLSNRLIHFDQKPGWLKWLEIDWPGGEVYVGDADCGYWPEAEMGARFELIAGRWQFDVRIADYGCERRVGAVRLRRPTSVPETDGAWGTFWTDSAGGALFPFPAPPLTQEQIGALYEALVEDRLETSLLAYTDWAGPPIYVFDSGFGDCERPIQKLTDGGFLIEFIEEGQEYPW